VRATLGAVLVQIILLDIVFSLDSVITAVGMVDELGVMIAAVVIAVGIMMVSAGAISNFVNHHPTLKMLALSFLLLVGSCWCWRASTSTSPRATSTSPWPSLCSWSF
jgi:predicted tellurium resistance membrane protein TerC